MLTCRLFFLNAGRRSLHAQKKECASCGYPAAKTRKCTSCFPLSPVLILPPPLGRLVCANEDPGDWSSADNWGEKAKRRKTVGTGRMRYLKDVSRRFKNGFQTGQPKGARGTKQEA